MNDSIDAICRALAHPLRRKLLRGLTNGECDVGVMQGKVAADQPTVSKHLAMLRDAGLVEVRIDGRRRCYSLVDPTAVHALFKQLDFLAVETARSKEPAQESQS